MNILDSNPWRNPLNNWIFEGKKAFDIAAEHNALTERLPKLVGCDDSAVESAEVAWVLKADCSEWILLQIGYYLGE